MITPDTDNQVFRLATDFVNQTAQHIFLTGKAGTGKTTFLKHICRTTHKNCIVAAPTGVAAINAGGMTLHSLFQLPFEPFVPGMEYRNSKERFKISVNKRDMLRQMELLVIDEVSMLRADTLDSIDSVLRHVRRSDRPFGGVQMLYIGDLFQLPPVVKDEEWSILRDYYASPFFFHAKAVQKVPPVYLELKKVYRQREQYFVDLLNRVRNDVLTDDDLRVLDARCSPRFEAPPGEKYITLTTRNVKADNINNREMARLPGRAYQFTGEIKGEFPEYALPTEMTLTLKKNAQIMFIKNDLSDRRRYFNGKLATVSNIDDDGIEVRLEGSGDVFVIERETWKNVRYTLNKSTGEIEEEELGVFVQYPVRLAWAITIHKSQGLTFERAIIDAGDAFAPGQAYVALSRCTSLEGIVLLSHITRSSVQTDAHAVRLTESEKEESELQRILASEKQRFWAERLLKYFDCDALVDIPRHFFKLLEDKDSDDYLPARTLARTLSEQAHEIRSVSEKFRAQLHAIVRQQPVNMDLLAERCRKATEYFHQTIVDRMLAPLQRYITGLKVKKAKTFHKNVCGLESDLKLFIENMKKVRYNDIPLVADLNLHIPERDGLYQSPSTEAKKGYSESDDFEKRKQTHESEVNSPAKKSRQPDAAASSRIPSNRQSFDLFGEGLSVTEIAQARSISETTVMSHLAEFVQSGELSVYNLLPRATVEELTPQVRAAIAEDTIRLAPIKEMVGDKFSYSDIRLVMSHCLCEKNKNK